MYNYYTFMVIKILNLRILFILNIKFSVFSFMNNDNYILMLVFNKLKIT